MALANLDRMKAYLQAVEAMGSYESVAQFSAPDVTFHEFPNRIAPEGRVRRGDELRRAWEQGRKIMKSQTYRVQRAIENGDDMAVELEWTGVLAVPVMNLPAGTELKAFVAMFLRFRDGKIVEQRNYDCYPPFGPSS